MFFGILLFIYASIQAQQPCFNNMHTFIINVKIYMDRNSVHRIANYTAHELIHKADKKIDTSHKRFEIEHVKHYIGVIFNEMNMLLHKSNIQLKADYSDMFKEEFSELNSKYCGHFKNIVEIAEKFLEDFENPHEDSENKLLIIECSHNNQPYPRGTHIATKNGCGKVLTALLADPEILKSTISELLLSIFSRRSSARVLGIRNEAAIDACKYVQDCNLRYTGLGTIRNDLEIVKHRSLEESGPVGLSYNIGKNYMKNFNLGRKGRYYLEDEHNIGHDVNEGLNAHHGSYRHSSGGHIPSMMNQM